MRIQKSKKRHSDNSAVDPGPQRVQLCAKLRLINVLYHEPVIPEDVRIEVYANSLMTVCSNGLSDKPF